MNKAMVWSYKRTRLALCFMHASQVMRISSLYTEEMFVIGLQAIWCATRRKLHQLHRVGARCWECSSNRRFQWVARHFLGERRVWVMDLISSWWYFSTTNLVRSALEKIFSYVFDIDIELCKSSSRFRYYRDSSSHLHLTSSNYLPAIGFRLMMWSQATFSKACISEQTHFILNNVFCLFEFTHHLVWCWQTICCSWILEECAANEHGGISIILCSQTHFGQAKPISHNLVNVQENHIVPSRKQAKTLLNIALVWENLSTASMPDTIIISSSVVL